MVCALGWPEFEISGEIQQIAGKAVNNNTVKTIKTWMNVWKSWEESRDLKADIVKYEAKELDECFSRYFTDICKKAIAPTMSHTA